MCVQTPVLTQTAMYTAACFLNETGHLDKPVTMAHKSQAISMLNEKLWTESCSKDETVAAHTQLILNEWYWGAGTDLGAHLRGLKEMVSQRGGFRSLGLHGLVAKMAITYVSTPQFAFSTAWADPLTHHTERTSPSPSRTRPRPSRSPGARSTCWRTRRSRCGWRSTPLWCLHCLASRTARKRSNSTRPRRLYWTT